METLIVRKYARNIYCPVGMSVLKYSAIEGMAMASTPCSIEVKKLPRAAVPKVHHR